MARPCLRLRKCLSVTRLTACAGEDALPQGGTLRVRAQVHHGRQPGLTAHPGCAGPEALQPAARGQMPAPAARPCTGQVADQMANTPRNIRVRPPRLCYFYCMFSPIRGKRIGIRVQVSPLGHKTGDFPNQALLEHACGQLSRGTRVRRLVQSSATLRNLQGTSRPENSRPPTSVRMPPFAEIARQQPESPDSPGQFRSHRGGRASDELTIPYLWLRTGSGQP
jgi:hypothetical protein